MEKQLCDVEDWFRFNKLTVNAKKCEVIFFGSKQKLTKCKETKITFCNNQLESKNKVKDLGVIFDEEVTWKNHVNAVVKKIGYKLSKITRIKHCLNENTKKQLVNALIMPYYYYCSVAWCSVSDAVLKKIENQFERVKRLHRPEKSIRNLLNRSFPVYF
jgi:enoyl-[acyl-carrier-protein] reductase (NADH)